MTEIPVGTGPAQIALAFGVRPEEAALQAASALVGQFEPAWDEYVANWHAFLATCAAPPDLGDDLDRLYHDSAAVLRVHQDRTAAGATVASLSIPWGSARNDIGGYHLVWSRDLVESAGALVALGARASARRTLAYLVATQEPDGHWVQNQWVDGVAYWGGVQLDEAAYPILLVGALRRSGGTHMHGQGGDEAAAFAHLVTGPALDRMIESAASFIARTGPATQQDRWEENPGLPRPRWRPSSLRWWSRPSTSRSPRRRTASSWRTTGMPRSRTGHSRAAPNLPGPMAWPATTSGLPLPTCWRARRFRRRCPSATGPRTSRCSRPTRSWEPTSWRWSGSACAVRTTPASWIRWS